MKNILNLASYQKPQKYQNIQILRILACIGVFCVHFGQRIDAQGEIRKFTDFGANGVQMFFIISGFVAFSSLANKKINIKQYYISRLIRIIPVYYLIIVYNIVLHAIILKDVPADIMHLGWLRYIFFLNILIPGYDNFWSNLSATWTIPCFMLFYLVFPIFSKYIRNLKLCVLVGALFWGVSFVNIPYINLIPLHSLYYFFIGGIIFYIVQEKKEAILIVVCTILIIFLGIKLVTWNVYIWVGLFTILIVSSMNIKIENKFIQKAINEVDSCSYTIYLVHAIFIELIDIYKDKSLNGGSKSMIWAIGVIGTIVCSIFIHKLFEEPVTVWLKEKTLKSL